MDTPQKNKIFLTPLNNGEIRLFQEIEQHYANVSRERYALIPTRNAFLLRETDVLQLSSGIDTVKIEKNADVLHIYKSNEETPVAFDPALAELVEAILENLSSPQVLADLGSSLANRWEVKTVRSVCEQLLGTCVEIPDTIDTLERKLPLNGLLRFPVHSPYKVPRTYWENSIAVRQALPLLYDASNSKEGFIKALAGLHRIATVGESGGNIYGGGGGIPTEPGVYRQQIIETKVARWCLKTLEWWLVFLNVPINLIKKGIIKSIEKRPMVEIRMDGIQCMHLYDANGVSVLKLLDEARGNLQGAIQSAKKARNDMMLGQLARFMQLFAIAHPFNNINASIAMNIVNDILERQKLGRLPHLYLDYVAQRTHPGDFSLVFKAVFEKHRITGSNSEEVDTAKFNMRRLLETAAAYRDAEKITPA